MADSFLHGDQQFSTVPSVKVYWRPGCSSCARVKEFLTDKGIAYEAVDVVRDPAAMARLAALGIRSVPVVMRGDDFTFAQSLDDVANFLAIEADAPDRLSPTELIGKWAFVLAKATQLVHRMPSDSWRHEPVPGQTMLGLAYHIFRIPVSFVECVDHGVADWVAVAMEPPPAGMADGPALVSYGDAVRHRLLQWWAAVADKSCTWPVSKYDGVHTAHVFLERQVWHTAHHTRQLADALDRLGVDASSSIPPSTYAGLPLPSRIW